MLIRASSLSDLFDCPKRFEAKHINKKTLPKTSIAQLGTAIHAGTGAFDYSKIVNNPITVDDAIGEIVDNIYKPECEVIWEENSQKEAEQIAISLHKKYCAEISPKYKFLAVEAKSEEITITDLDLTFTGTLDRLYLDEFDNIGIMDLKTGKQAVSASGEVDTRKHKTQIGIYTILAKHSLKKDVSAPAVITGLTTAKTEESQRVGIGIVENPISSLIGNEYNKGVLQIAADIIKTGLFFGNPRSMMCHKNYCPIYSTCNFK